MRFKNQALVLSLLGSWLVGAAPGFAQDRTSPEEKLKRLGGPAFLLNSALTPRSPGAIARRSEFLFLNTRFGSCGGAAAHSAEAFLRVGLEGDVFTGFRIGADGKKVGHGMIISEDGTVLTWGEEFKGKYGQDLLDSYPVDRETFTLEEFPKVFEEAGGRKGPPTLRGKILKAAGTALDAAAPPLLVYQIGEAGIHGVNRAKASQLGADATWEERFKNAALQASLTTLDLCGMGLILDLDGIVLAR